MQEPATFFIAEKLRGIPLVTAAARAAAAGQRDQSGQSSRKKNGPKPVPTASSRAGTVAPPRADKDARAQRLPSRIAGVSSPPRRAPVPKEDSSRPVRPAQLGKLLRSAAFAAASPLPESRPSVGLAEASSSLQRRAQPVSAAGPNRSISKSNKLNGNAASPGENWRLFNSGAGSGGLAFFEMMALAANLLIGGTVILVILVHWVKSLKKRKQDAQLKCGEQSLAEQTTAKAPISSMIGGKGSPSEQTPVDMRSHNDGRSPVQPVSPLSANTSDSASKTPKTGRAGSRPVQQANGGPQKESGAAPTKPGAVAQPTAAPSSGAPTATPAPAESTIKDQATQAIGAPIRSPGEAAAAAASAARSTETNPFSPSAVSSSGNGARPDDQNKSAEQDKTTTRPPTAMKPQARVAGGAEKSAAGGPPEQAKGGAAPAVLDQMSQEPPGSQAKKEPTNARQSADQARSASANSLDSIELPESLFKGAPKPGELNVLAQAEPKPSPNLLLGESEINTALASKQASSTGNPSSARQLADARANGAPQSNSLGDPRSISANSDRPDNPMGRDKQMNPGAPAIEPNKRQLVVNKLDKRKVELEIVDLRDKSVAGKIKADALEEGEKGGVHDEGWISMDGVAVVHNGPTNSEADHKLLPSDIIESRFKVDYAAQKSKVQPQSSIDSSKGAILEPEMSKLKNNRKYFVYIVQDGHFSAKKECIARIELPPKRRVTLAEMRNLIANSQDISLASLRRNKFKFVTETYRLLNENEDATVLHQVYPTQGVFLKLNIPEQDALNHHPMHLYAPKSARNYSPTRAGGSSSLAQPTTASRNRSNDGLPLLGSRSRTRLVSSGRQSSTYPGTGTAYVRSKSNVSPTVRKRPPSPPQLDTSEAQDLEKELVDRLPTIGRSGVKRAPALSAPKLSKDGASLISGAKRFISNKLNL